MSRKNRRFGIERLESRQLMAGDVAANMVNGDLYLTEASGQAGLDNSVFVSQLSNGNIRVASNFTLDNSMSKINGAAFQDFRVPGSLHVNFGAGNDLAVLGSGSGTDTPHFYNVDINLAAPPLVNAPPVAALATPTIQGDNDAVIVWAMNTRGTTTINTGGGDDEVFIGSSTLGDGFGADDVSINTGSGADSVRIQDNVGMISGKVDIQTYSSLAETDHDIVWLSHIAASGDIALRTGGGSDFAHVFNTTSYKSINIDSGTGDDTVEVNYACAVDNFMANLGDGNDTLNITDLYTIHGKTQLSGGAGVDHLNKSGSTPAIQLDQNGWEFLNGRINRLPPVQAYPIALAKR